MRTYYLKWPYFLFICAIDALLLAPGAILIPSFQNGDRGVGQLGVFVFEIVAACLLFDLGILLTLGLLRVRLDVSERGVRFHGLGYTLQSTWDNVAAARTDDSGALSGLALRQPGIDRLGWLGVVSALVPALSVVNVMRGRPTLTMQFDDRFIPIEPFGNDRLQADVRRYAPTDSAAPAAAPAQTSGRAAPSAAAALNASMPEPSRSSLLVAGLAIAFVAVVVAEYAWGRSVVQHWLGDPPAQTLATETWPSGLAFSADSQFLMVARGGINVQFWRLSDGALIQELPVTTTIASFALSADGQMMAIGADNGSVTLWVALLGQRLRALPRHDGAVRRVAFSPDGQRAASASDDGTIILSRVADGALLYTLHASAGASSPDTVNDVAFSPNGQFLVAAVDSLDKPVQLWRVSDGVLVAAYDGGTFAESAAFAPDGKTIVAASFDHGLWVLGAGQLSLLRTLSTPGAAKDFTEWGVAVSPDGQLAASVTDGGNLQVWRLADGALLRTERGHTAPAHLVAFSPDGHFIATGALDSAVLVWPMR